MTGRQKIEAAFSAEGTDQFGVVLPYPGIYMRDHWDSLTRCPWWYEQSQSIEQQMDWRRDVFPRIGQDWFALRSLLPREDREASSIEVAADGVFLANSRTGARIRLEEPRVSGWSEREEWYSVNPNHLADTADEIDSLIPCAEDLDLEAVRASGIADLSDAMLSEFGREMYPICHVSSPLWNCYGLWGFDGMMTMIASRPDLVERACQRYLRLGLQNVRVAAMLGARGIWIEECLTDMISPAAFRSLNLPVVRRLVDEIRAAGLKSIYYYCGDPSGKWEQILSVGADALSLEEGKKGFDIDIRDVVERVQGKCVVFGNLDAIGTLQNGTVDQLQAEVSRQLAAGRENGGRFVMSLGSPVTPETSVERVQLYCDMVRST